jgi:3-oxoadipate enol-lactonase
LIHGGLASSAAWGRGVDDLEREMRVVTYDLRGYGGEPDSSSAIGVEEHARDLVEVWDAAGVRKSYLAGFSFGGMIALELAITAPERVAGLVLVSTAAVVDDERRRTYLDRAAGIREGNGPAMLADHVGLAFSEGFRDAHPEALEDYRSHVLSNDPLAAAGTFEAVAGFDRVSDLASIRCPTLVVAGGEDAGMGPRTGRTMYDAIPGAQMVVLPGRGHTIHIESPVTFSHLITDFVLQHSAAL